MNRTVLLLRAIVPMLLLLCLVGQPSVVSAQTLTCPPSPAAIPNNAGQCYATGLAGLTATATGATAVTWSISAPSAAVSAMTGMNTTIPTTQTFYIGASTVTFFGTGTTPASCSFVVTVTDTVKPTAVCKSMPAPVILNGSGSGMLTGADIDGGSTDACGGNITNVSVSPNTFSCTTAGMNMVTLTVTDFSGNTATCTTMVEVKDTLKPTVDCKNITVNLNAMGMAIVTASAVTMSSADNCSVDSTRLSKSSFTCANLGANVVTLTVADAAANSKTCTATVTITDINTPSATAAADITVDCASVPPTSAVPTVTGACSTSSALTSNTSTKNPDPSMMGHYNYTITRTWTVTNTNNTVSTTSVSQTITVEDKISPKFSNLPTTIDTISNVNDGCLGTVNLTVGSMMLSDTCAPFANIKLEQKVDKAGMPAGSFVTYNATALAKFPLGTSTVTFKATDPSNNTATHVVTITVKDKGAPIFNGKNLSRCGQAIVLDNTPGTCSNIFTWKRPDSSDIDDCTLTGITEHISNNVVAQSVNTSFGAYLYTTPSESVNGQFPLGTTTISYTANDDAAHITTCSFTVTIRDVQAPTLNCPANLTLSTTCVDADIPSYLNDVQVSDNCPMNVMLTQSPVAGTNLGTQFASPPMQGSTFMVTVTATDGMPNNTTPATCAITVHLEDGMAPLPTLSSLPNVIDSCGSLVVLAPTATEACNPAASIIYGTPSASVATFLNTNPPSYQFDYSTTGSNNYVITWVYDDGNGNLTSQLQNIKLLPDTFPATAICQPLNIALQADGDTTIAAALVNNGSFDPNDCGDPLAFSLSKTYFSCADLSYDTLSHTTFGLDTVILTVTDGAGNTSTCKTTIRVTDETEPVFNQNIPVDTTIQACSAIPSAPTITAFDACDPMAKVLYTQVSTKDTVGSGIYNYTITRNWFVKDTSGNSLSATQVITVHDTIAPTFVGAPTAITHLTGPDRTTCSDTVVIDLKPFVMDCTPYDSLTLFTNDGIANNGLVWKKELAIGTHVATFRATDQSGNTRTHTLTITVKDGTPPLAACVNGISVALSPSGNITLTPAQANNHSSDNCTPEANLIFSLSPSSFNCSMVGPTPPIVTLTVKDTSGNSASCNTFVEIQDNVAPKLTCPKDTVVNCNASTSIAALGSPTMVTDNCSTTILVSHVDTFSTTTGPICRQLYRTWSAEDVFGNIGTCRQTITIQDTVAPVFSVRPADDTLSCEFALPAPALVSVTDNCTPNMTAKMVQDTVAKALGICGKYEYTVRRTWTAKDSCGNAIAHTQHLRVIDTLAPALVGLADTVYFNTNAVPSNPSCGVAINFDLFNHVEECADSADIVAVTTGTGLHGNGAFNLSGFYSVGTYKASILMTDACGNSAVDTVTFIIRDNTTPQPDCIDQIVVALNADGQGDLLVADVNLNSTDNCGIDTMYLSKSLFDCSNLGSQMIRMTVVDSSGNSNFCDVAVLVQQGAAPTFTASIIGPDTTSYFGAMDGVLGVTASGGSSSFSYLWSTNAASNFITGLAAGSYTVTVSDNLTNCQMVLTGVVANGPAITLTIANATAPVGGTANVPITADKFTNITQMNFQVVGIDTNVVKITGVTNVNPAFGASLTTIPSGGGASLIVLWSNQTPMSIASNAVLFSVVVAAKGAIGSSTPAKFSNFIGLKQVQNGVTVDVPGVGVNGSVTIGASGGLKIAGGVEFWNNQVPVQNVTAKQTGQTNIVTGAAGTFSFDVPYASNENLSMEKFTTGNAGITSADLLRIVNNMFGTAFSSPYQWVAADVNNDGDVTVADITKIQRLALGSVAHLDTLPDWVFVPKSHTFPTSANPISAGFPTRIQRTGITQSYLSENFVAVRRGDVNGDSPVTLLATDDRFGNNTPFVISAEEQVAKVGTQIEVPFRAKDFNQRSAFQMTLDFDPSVLALKSVQGGVLGQKDENFGMDFINKGKLTTLWYDRQPVTLEDNAALFTLTFDVVGDMPALSQVLGLSSAITKAEGYDAFGETMPLHLDYVLPTSNGGTAFELQQNRPNPFKGSTSIGFVLPQDEKATIRFFDATGKLVRSINSNFVKGYNQVEVLAADLGAAGVYWYEITTKTNTDRKTLVVFE